MRRNSKQTWQRDMYELKQTWQRDMLMMMLMMIVILLYFPNHEGNATISIESNLCYAIIETTAMTSAAQQATSSDLVAHVVRDGMYMFLYETSQAARSSSLSPSCTCCASVGICCSKAYCSPLHFSFFSTSAVSVCFAMNFFSPRCSSSLEVDVGALQVLPWPPRAWLQFLPHAPAVDECRLFGCGPAVRILDKSCL